MNKLAIILFIIAILLGLVVFAVYRFQITDEVTLYAISLGISVIPEGLVAVLTITMAKGVRAMAANHAIVRKLSALEALGSVTNICSDKVCSCHNVFSKAGRLGLSLKEKW